MKYRKIVPLMMICLLPFGRICNLVVSSPDVLQISQPTNFPDYARDCRRVKFSYFSLDKVNGHLPFFVASFHTLVSENVQTMLRFNLWNFSIKQWKKDSFIKSTFYQVSKDVMKRLRLPIFTYYHLLWTKLIYS